MAKDPKAAPGQLAPHGADHCQDCAIRHSGVCGALTSEEISDRLALG